MSMRAMILAAGLGTRLKPITDNMPKPMIPVVGTANIERTIINLKQAGIDEIVINTHWKPDVLKSRLGNGKNLGVSICYSDEPELLGTGGGIKKAMPFLKNDTFLVVNGDALFTPDFDRIVRFHKAKQASATLVLREDKHAEFYGAVGIDNEGLVRRLVWLGKERIDLKPYMFTGVHVIEPSLAARLPDKGCIVRETYVPLIREQARIFGVQDNSFFCDLGTPERYLSANMNIVTGQKKIHGYHANETGVFLGRNVRLGKHCNIKHGTVLCDNSIIEDFVSLENTVVMENAVVKKDLNFAIVTPEHVLQIDEQQIQ